jgi:hypothetical protein
MDMDSDSSLLESAVGPRNILAIEKFCSKTNSLLIGMKSYNI